MKIRKAAPGDHSDLVRLRKVMLEYMTGSQLSPRELQVMEDFFQGWDYDEPRCLVAEEDGKVMVCVAASFYRAFPGPKNSSGLHAVLHNFAVYREYRGRGVGRALFAHVLEECRDRGVGRISLYATDMGRPIYESFGFSHEVIVWPEMRLYHKDLVELDL